MQKKGANISLKGYDDIFSTDQSRAEAQQERVQEIPLSELHPFEGHPFRVVDDEDMMKTVESVRDFGVLTPAIVRPDPDGGYEIISGHRRHRASELAGKETMPAIVRDMDDDAAIILMVDSNLQRETLLPSERAFAYRMKLDAIKHQGQTCGQVGHKSRDALSDSDILISCGARLAPFDIQEVRDITAYDELQLDTLGDKKTALFLIMSDTDATFNFLISMIYTQLFNLLCEKADDVYGGRLPVHVRCLIDEAANIGQIPNLEKLVATIRSREISACLVLQAQSQLKAIYKDNSDTIIGNMDSRIFLGGSEPTTLKELNQALGKETIDTYNTSNTRGNSPSYGMNYQKLGKDMPYLFVKSSVALNLS